MAYGRGGIVKESSTPFLDTVLTDLSQRAWAESGGNLQHAAEIYYGMLYQLATKSAQQGIQSEHQAMRRKSGQAVDKAGAALGKKQADLSWDIQTKTISDFTNLARRAGALSTVGAVIATGVKVGAAHISSIKTLKKEADSLQDQAVKIVQEGLNELSSQTALGDAKAGALEAMAPSAAQPGMGFVLEPPGELTVPKTTPPLSPGELEMPTEGWTPLPGNVTPPPPRAPLPQGSLQGATAMGGPAQPTREAVQGLNYPSETAVNQREVAENALLMEKEKNAALQASVYSDAFEPQEMNSIIDSAFNAFLPAGKYSTSILQGPGGEAAV
jgi:hypothetical protein